MPISGLRILLHADSVAGASAIRDLRDHNAFDLGIRRDRHLAAVLDTPDETSRRAAWTWLTTHPGVEHVDVVFVSYDDESQDAPPTPHRPNTASIEVTP